MGQCRAWLNGTIVGTVFWNEATGDATVRCTLPEGWIYRAVLLLEGQEIANFGVLLLKKGVFTTELQVPSIGVTDEALLRCEILRSLPREAGANGGVLAFPQFSHWSENAFQLESALKPQVNRNSDVFYRIYNQQRYLLLRLDLVEPDPLVTMCTIGKPMKIKNQWFLCLRIDEAGKPTPWATDEK